MGDHCAGCANHWVRNINLQEVTLPSFLNQFANVVLKLLWVLHPFQPTSQEVLTHHSTILILGIQVLKVMSLFARIEPFTHILLVCLHISMNCLSGATSSTLFKHQQHVGAFRSSKLTSVFLRQDCQANLREV